MLTQERLKELLDYNPETGIFTRKVSSGRYNRWKVGSIVGCNHGNGYLRIVIDKKPYFAHRLAWFYMYGIWPKLIDHKDHDCANNQIDNLRDVTKSENNQNQIKARRSNKTGLLGVTWDKQVNKYPAQIGLNGKTIQLGKFSTADEAHQAYLEAKRILHSTCTI